MHTDAKIQFIQINEFGRRKIPPIFSIDVDVVWMKPMNAKSIELNIFFQIKQLIALSNSK